MFMCGYSCQQCCVKEVSSISILKSKARISRKEPGRTHTYTQEEEKHLLQVAWTPAPPEPKKEGPEPSVHTTTSDSGSLLRNSAAASGRLGSKRKQTSMTVVTVKFGVQGRVGGHNIRFSLEA